MEKKNQELAKIEADRAKAEVNRLLGEIEARLAKVPPSVITGSHNKAVAFKAAAAKGVSLLKSARPTLIKVRECARELAVFY